MKNEEKADLKKAWKEHKEFIESDIIVVPDGNTGWAVISTSGGTRPMGVPMVIYAGFETREAAELARGDAVGVALEDGDGRVYGPSEVTVQMWEQLAEEERLPF